MQTAHLYIRVSTDEQAIKGYSLPVQEEKLRQFCIANNIQALKTIEEDYSAKTFNRPAWSKLIVDLNRHKNQRPDLILFTKWDRFSRNVADAYYMIRVLENLGIEPQAIDQPLDLAVPENKILLAVYIAAAEAENDRRSLNVKQGIHKARQEGHWTAHPPLGYTRQLSAQGRMCLVPKEPEASFIRLAFELILSDSHRSIQSIYEQLTAAGLKCSISHFWRIIRNPVYCGKVIVPALGGGKAYLVQGLHEAIVPELLFHKVQHILDEKKRKLIVISHPNDKLLLRGFVYCPNCGKRLTGSGSKGRHDRYYYYHCNAPCRFRIRADKINQLFYTELGKLTADKGYQDLYRDILRQTRKELFTEQTISQKAITQIIDRLIERILKAKELLLKGEIANDDFQIIKADCEQRINLMGLQLQHATILTRRNKKNLNKVVLQLSQLDLLLSTSDYDVKRKLIALVLNDKPVLTEKAFFNNVLNFAIQSIYNLKITSRKTSRKATRNSQSTDAKFNREIRSKVMEYELRRNNEISGDRAQEIVDFMVNLAVLSTERLH